MVFRKVFSSSSFSNKLLRIMNYIRKIDHLPFLAASQNASHQSEFISSSVFAIWWTIFRNPFLHWCHVTEVKPSWPAYATWISFFLTFTFSHTSPSFPPQSKPPINQVVHKFCTSTIVLFWHPNPYRAVFVPGFANMSNKIRCYVWTTASILTRFAVNH